MVRIDQYSGAPYMTWSIPKHLFCSHFLVCSKNHIFIVGIGPIRDKELKFTPIILIWSYVRFILYNSTIRYICDTQNLNIICIISYLNIFPFSRELFPLQHICYYFIHLTPYYCTLTLSIL